MVLTVEPGLYFGSWRNDIHVPERYSGIGIRIEDDILITDNGPIVLTSMVPKTIEDIEELVGIWCLKMDEIGTILEDQLSDDPPILTIPEAASLYEKAPLNDLLFVANKMRERRVPGRIVTYLIDRNINYTNICTINCHFCSFYRPPGHKENYTQSINQISERIRELEEIGGSRILMQGGVKSGFRTSNGIPI